jgi:heme oxygenase
MQINQENGLHRYLKATVKELHDKLENNSVLSPLFGENVSIEDYANALATLHGFYAAVEKNILDFLANQPDLFNYQARLKTPALEDDLKMLGKTPFISNIEFPAPKNVAELVGMLYVLEGSTMGGQFLARKIGNKFPIRFFTGYGENTTQKWQEFWEFANTVCPVQQYQDVAKITTQLFESIELHFKFHTI